MESGQRHMLGSTNESNWLSTTDQLQARKSTIQLSLFAGRGNVLRLSYLTITYLNIDGGNQNSQHSQNIKENSQNKRETGQNIVVKKIININLGSNG